MRTHGMIAGKGGGGGDGSGCGAEWGGLVARVACVLSAYYTHTWKGLDWKPCDRSNDPCDGSTCVLWKACPNLLVSHDLHWPIFSALLLLGSGCRGFSRVTRLF